MGLGKLDSREQWVLFLALLFGILVDLVCHRKGSTISWSLLFLKFKERARKQRCRDTHSISGFLSLLRNNSMHFCLRLGGGSQE